MSSLGAHTYVFKNVDDLMMELCVHRPSAVVYNWIEHVQYVVTLIE